MIDTLLPRLRLRGRSLLPVLQGGMGVGISAHRLAGAVAAAGAVGTIASVELRRLHADIMQRTFRRKDAGVVLGGNLEALDREIRAARHIAGREGFLAVNVMRALSGYPALVRQACESGADAIVMGAGLPLDLPDLVEGHDVALIPILSEERGVRALMRRWLRKGRVPDAIVLEHPGHAGGHLGATRIEEVNDARFDFSHVLGAVREVIEKLGIDPDSIPLIPAGGVNSRAKVDELFAQGASAVQVGTPFAVSEEGDAHVNFKRVLCDATPEDIVTFQSAAGLPARAVRTPWLARYLGKETRLRELAATRPPGCPRAVDCLSYCGFKDRDPAAGQFCIETQLAAAQRGDVERGLFFRGAASLPFGREIRPVRDVLACLLEPRSVTPA